MHPKSIKEILSQIDALPPLPAAAQKIITMADNPKTDGEALGKVLAMDPALAGRILRVSNSAFYGLSRTISTITQAILIIGFEGVRNLALGVSVFKGSSQQKTDRPLPLHQENFWRHCLAVATCARLLASKFCLRVPEEAFVAGLLHDIGKVILMEHFCEAYAEIIHEANQSGKHLNLLEKEAFGMDHTEIGEKICLHWKMPSNLAAAVSDHHIPFKEGLVLDEKDGIVQVVRISDKLAKIARIGFDGDANVAGDFLSILGQKGFYPEHLRQVLLALPEEVNKVEVFFELNSDGETDKERDSKKQIACVLLGDSIDQEFVGLLLLSMGVNLISKDQLANMDDSLSGVIIDDTLTPQLKDKLTKGGIPILNYATWKAEHHMLEGPINIPDLQTCLECFLGG